ncbi:MAG TPA: Uma2 family endonuclease [Acidobacteriota bacterium]
MTIGLKTRLDYRDYSAMPANGKRYELLDGELRVTPAPSPQHQRIVLRLAQAVQRALPSSAELFVAPIDLILGEHDVLQPDIVVVDDPQQITERGIEGPARLIIEVLSPNTAEFDRTVKAVRYGSFGIEHYWLVDLKRREVECYRLQGRRFELFKSYGSADQLQHPDFPALSFPLADLWL